MLKSYLRRERIVTLRLAAVCAALIWTTSTKATDVNSIWTDADGTGLWSDQQHTVGTAPNQQTLPGDWSTTAYPNNGSGNLYFVEITNVAPASDDVSVTISSLQIDNGASLGILAGNTLTIVNGIADNGTITVNSNSGGNGTLLSFNGGTLSGTGSVVLNHSGADAQLNGSLTQATGHTIQGQGQINATLINNGTVNANVSGGTLTLLTNAMTNNNLFEASSGGTLAITGITVTQGSSGQISAAGTGSLVNLTGSTTIVGGILSTSSGGAIESSGTNTLSSLTNDAAVNVLNGTTLNVAGDLTDNGTITVNSNSGGNGTLLSFNGGTLSGTGSIVLNRPGVDAQLKGSLTQASGHTIQGQGQINATLTNNGTVNANVSGGTLALLTNAMTNNNLFEATSGGTLAITGIAVTQGSSGIINAGDGSTVSLATGAILGGIFNSSGTGAFNISGTDTFSGLTNNAAVNVLNSTALNVAGDLTDNGTVTVNSNSGDSNTVLSFNGGTLSGTGSIVLDHGGVTAQVNGSLTQASGHAIQGQGQINATFTNNGAVNANVNAATLTVTGTTTNNGLMQASGGGMLALQTNTMTNNNTFEATTGGILTISGITVTQAPNGAITAGDSGTVSLVSGQITGGILNSSGTGAFNISGTSDTFNGLTNNATINILNGTTLNVSGDLTDNGIITVNSNSGSTSTVLGFNGGTLSGTGSIVLNRPGSGAQLTGLLTQASGHKIQGQGQINAAFNNNGAVNANVTGGTLTLQTNAMTNSNVFEATSGGTLAISGITVTQGSSGQISAAGTGSLVNLTGSTTIAGGILSSSSGGEIQSSGTNTLSNLTNDAAVNVLNSTTLNVAGDLTDNGTITVNSNSGGNGTLLSFNGGTLSGTGSVVLNHSGADAQLNGSLTQATGHTIQGQGQINATLINNGTVNANVSGGTLTLLTNAMTNNNLFEASSGGTLAITGITVTQGSSGQISAAGTGSLVNLTGSTTIVGGILSTSSGGAIESSGTNTLSSLTNDAAVNVLNGTTLNVAGDLTDNGTITVNSNSGGNGTLLSFNGGTLSGTGSIVLNRPGVDAQLKGSLTQASGHTIQGQGQINATLTNNGTVNANVSGGTLAVNDTTTNNGLMQASDGGTLQFTSGELSSLSGTTLTNGSYEVDANSTITLPGSIVANAANIKLGGSGYSFSALNSLTSNTGSLTLASGATFNPTGALTNSGTIVLDGGGTLSLSSTLTLSSTSTLAFNLGGLTQGTQYGKIDVTGGLADAGTLQLSLKPGFVPVAGNSFDLFDWGSLTGTFSAVQLPTLGGNLVWNTSLLYTTGVISVASDSMLPGDFNQNGVLDTGDIAGMMAVLTNLSGYAATSNLTLAQLLAIADVNGDGYLDNADLQALLNDIRSGSSSTSVPEPATISLLAVSGMILMLSRLLGRHAQRSRL